MLKAFKRNLLPGIIALSAISVSASAAFYSVFGLSKLFAGASTEVIIMAGSLEVAKLVTASLLYQYWDTINKYLRTYLTVATVILVIITSIGIYGFLSAAYQDTYQKLIINQNKVEFLENKAQFYENDVKRFDSELQQILDNISNLSNAKSRSIQVKDTSVVGGIRNTISTVDLRLAQNRLTIEENNRKDVYLRRTVAADSLQKYKLEILELENNADISGELGPLKYLSGLTGTPMDRIINWLLLIIIFVFDPLAISLVVAANFAFNQANRKNLYGEVESDSEDLYEEALDEAKNAFPKDYDEAAEKRMDIIGQNGNEGVHYDEEGEPVTVTKVTRILQKGPSKNRVVTDQGEEKWVNKDDNTIRYL
tara:strand:+ start:3188 stop:4288 length:1101 start_codon:yes stop_codon:yes gene_type:complete